jgi:hypothetical protein
VTPPPPPAAPGGGGRIRGAAALAAAAAAAAGPEITTLTLTCSSVNLREVKPEANTILAEAVAEELRARGAFFNTNVNDTKVTGEIIGSDSTNLTIRFNVTVSLARPIKL